MNEYFAAAELAYRRERLQASWRARHLGRPSLLQRLRDARRLRRDPVRGALQYESDGPLTRRPYDYRLSSASHH
jgi:hypothetical protein